MKKRTPKRQPKKYPWQVLKSDATDYEKDYVRTLTDGLEQSPNIWVLIQGLTGWLVQVAAQERERQGHTPKLWQPGDSLDVPKLSIN